MLDIGQDYGDAPLLMIKDPRLCRLLPLYLEAFDVLDIEPLVVLQVRPMVEVARSLIDRDNLDPGLSELLWLRSLIEAERYSRSCARVWVSYRQMIADWHDTVCRIASALGLAWPVGPDDAAHVIERILKPRLNHGQQSAAGLMNGLPAPSRQPPLAAQAWQAVEYGLTPDEPAAKACFDTVGAILEDLDRMYEPFMTGLERQHVEEVAAIRASTSWRITAPMRALRRWARGGGSMQCPVD
jgi:hypothetical protein